MAINFFKNQKTRWLLPALLVASVGWAVSHGYTIKGKIAPPTLNKLSLKPGGDFQPLVPLKNKTKRPDMFVANLTAAVKNVPSKPHRIFQQATNFMLYNGRLPGPLLDVKAGDHVKIKFANKLAKKTTVHFHGLPIPPAQDGNPMDAVARGKSRLYDFIIPATIQGSFWYHPHPHKHATAQAAAGLAGAMIVRAKNDPLRRLGISEKNIFITGLRLANGRIDKNREIDWQNGRVGETLLVNGVVQPVLKVKPGSTHRLRIWNATNGRFIALSLKKGVDPTAPNIETYLVGTDGGLIDRPFLENSDEGIMLSSAERRELVVRFDGKPGDVYSLFEEYPILPERARGDAVGDAGDAGDGDDGNMSDSKLGVAHNMGGGHMELGIEVGVKKPLMTIKLIEGATATPIVLPKKLRTIRRLPATPIKKTIEFTGQLSNFFVNGKKFNMKRIDYVSKKGTVEEWSIVNNDNMTHTIHIHGGQFQIVGRASNGGGVAKPLPPYLAWQDTAAVLPNETLVLRMKQDFVGIRMIHCHILEHEEKGMMATINVVE